MARERAAFGMALDELRGRLRSGAISPGATIEVGDLARSLRISSTPIREALSRLTGEGLVAEDRGRGFQARRLDADDLGVLYRRHAYLVMVAFDIRSTRRGDQAPPGCSPPGPWAAVSDQGPASLAHNVESFWRFVVRSGDSEELIDAHSTLSDRLSLPRQGEFFVFSDLEAELRQLAVTMDDGNPTVIAAASHTYHARRLQALGPIAREVRRISLR